MCGTSQSKLFEEDFKLHKEKKASPFSQYARGKTEIGNSDSDTIIHENPKLSFSHTGRIAKATTAMRERGVYYSHDLQDMVSNDGNYAKQLSRSVRTNLQEQRNQLGRSTTRRADDGQLLGMKVTQGNSVFTNQEWEFVKRQIVQEAGQGLYNDPDFPASEKSLVSQFNMVKNSEGKAKMKK